MTRPAWLHGGLLAVHAHPDDETLASGALLATWAAAGEHVTVVTCTRGERGEVIDTAAHPTGLAALEGDGPALAAHREREIAAALSALGVREHHFLDTLVDSPLDGRDQVGQDTAVPGGSAPDLFSPGAPTGAPGAPDARRAAGPDAGAGRPSARYEDSGMAWVAPGIAAGASDGVPQGAFVAVPLDDAAARLAVLLRARRPRVVATYEPGGGYGHPDHVRAHAVAVRATELAALDGADGTPGWQVPELWCVVVPAAELRAARRELAAAAPTGLTLPDPDEPVLPPAVTWWPDAARAAGAARVPVTVEVAPVLDRVLAALRAHATQVQAVEPLPGRAHLVGRYALSNDVVAPLPAHETYAVVPLPADAGTVGA